MKKDLLARAERMDKTLDDMKKELLALLKENEDNYKLLEENKDNYNALCRIKDKINEVDSKIDAIEMRFKQVTSEL